MSTPAGWYDDGSGRQRWWDGSRWTEHFAPAEAPAPQSATIPDAGTTGAPAPDAGYTPPSASAYGAAAYGAPAYGGTAAGAAPERRKPSLLAWIGLGAGVLGLILSCIPVAGVFIVGWVLLFAGLVVSIVALFRKGAKWAPITGTIVAVVGGIVAVILGIVFTISALAHTALDQYSDELEGLSEQFDDLADGGTGAEGTDGSAGTDGTEIPDLPFATAEDFAVTIDGAEHTKDYEGQDAVLVDFTFTNNSDDEASFLFSINAAAYQDGIQLDDAFLLDEDYTGAQLAGVKPGASIEVQRAYLLHDDSDVTVETSALISFDDEPIASRVFSLD